MRRQRGTVLVTLAALFVVTASGTSDVVAPCATTVSPLLAVTVPVSVYVTDPPAGRDAAVQSAPVYVTPWTFTDPDVVTGDVAVTDSPDAARTVRTFVAVDVPRLVTVTE